MNQNDRLLEFLKAENIQESYKEPKRMPQELEMCFKKSGAKKWKKKFSEISAILIEFFQAYLAI